MFLEHLKGVAQCWGVCQVEGINNPISSVQALAVLPHDGHIDWIILISTMDDQYLKGVFSGITTSVLLHTVYKKERTQFY